MRQDREYRIGKESKFLYIGLCGAVGPRAAEIEFIVDEIEFYAGQLGLHQPDVLFPAGKAGIEMRDLLHVIAKGILDAAVTRKDHTDVIMFFVKILRQRSGNVGKTAGLDKGNGFRCGKKHIRFHMI